MVRASSLTTDVQPDQPFEMDVASGMVAALADVIFTITPRTETRFRALGKTA